MSRKNLILAGVLVVILGAIVYLESQRAGNSDGALRQELGPALPGAASSSAANAPVSVASRADIIQEKRKKYPPAVEIAGPTGFINAEEFNLASLVGQKVILIDFWTYSCINCIRTFPYLNSWYEKYRDKGFVIVGVHTPEFEFEKKYENVLEAVKRFGIKYPIVLDSDYGTWRAYGNAYWPAEYLIDIDGFIVHHTIGEGHYAETEKAIQMALAERMEVLGETEKIASNISQPKDASGVTAAQLGSPEIYFGAARNEYLGNGIKHKTGAQSLAYPTVEIKSNTLYLSGAWDFRDEFIENTSSSARILFRYKAKNVYIVASAAKPVTFSVLRDGKPLGVEAGEDVHLGRVTVQEDRLYNLIEDPTGYGEHTIEIIIDNPGLKVFTFTFG